jgi:branched-subunit amino acid transport protein
MDTVYVLWAIAGITASTILTRASFFLLPRDWQLPARIERALRYAPACALIAIIVPEVLTQKGELFLSLDNDKLWAVLAGSIVFWRTRNMLLMMGVGMLVFTLLRLYA